MHELTLNRPAADLFIEGYTLGYLESWRRSPESGAPVIENLGFVHELYSPGDNEYFRVRDGFRIHFVLSNWPDALPTLPRDVIVKIAPFVHLSGHEPLMGVLDDKQLELLSDWHKTIVRSWQHRGQELPLRTIQDVLYVLDEVVQGAEEDTGVLLDALYEHESRFTAGVHEALDRFRTHYMGIISASGDNYPSEAVYCEPYTRLLNTWEEEYGDYEELHPCIEHRYKGGGFTCIN